MEIQLTTDQKAFARSAVESGRLQSEEEAVREALEMWEERERRKLALLATLHDARVSLAPGRGRMITRESMNDLAKEIADRGRAQLSAELTTTFKWRTWLRSERRLISTGSGCMLPGKAGIST